MRYFGSRGPQPRLELPVPGKECFALAVGIENRRGDRSIQNSKQGDQKRQCEETSGSAGRQVGEGGYGTISTVIVNTSSWFPSMRVTGAAKVALRNLSPPASIAISRDAAADRPVSVTLRCCCAKSVR